MGTRNAIVGVINLAKASTTVTASCMSVILFLLMIFYLHVFCVAVGRGWVTLWSYKPPHQQQQQRQQPTGRSPVVVEPSGLQQREMNEAQVNDIK